MERTLWWEEKGVSQWTARLWAQTRRTMILMGNIQIIRRRMEWV